MDEPPLSVVPSGSLNESKCRDDEGREFITFAVFLSDATSGPWIKGMNSKGESAGICDVGGYGDQL